MKKNIKMRDFIETLSLAGGLVLSTLLTLGCAARIFTGDSLIYKYAFPQIGMFIPNTITEAVAILVSLFMATSIIAFVNLKIRD